MVLAVPEKGSLTVEAPPNLSLPVDTNQTLQARTTRDTTAEPSWVWRRRRRSCCCMAPMTGTIATFPIRAILRRISSQSYAPGHVDGRLCLPFRVDGALALATANERFRSLDPQTDVTAKMWLALRDAARYAIYCRHRGCQLEPETWSCGCCGLSPAGP
jgi:hypothetical protein